MNKKLKNLIALESNVKIYIPSTTDVNNSFDNSEIVDKALSFMSSIFGGSTSYKALGCWNSASAGLVKEKVTICESFCTSQELDLNIEKIIDFAEDLKKSLTQEAIAIEVNNNLYFV